MQLKIHDWLFEVDVGMNMEISAMQASEHCTCGYCRNFYQALDHTYPAVRSFLARFGIDPFGPDELSPFQPTIYEASFIIQGSVLQWGSDAFCVDGIPVKVLSSQDADMDTVRPAPYFVLAIGLMELPWMLDEDPDQVISPANEESYLQRMEQKLLRRMDNESLYS